MLLLEQTTLEKFRDRKTRSFQQYMKADVNLPSAVMKLPMEGDFTQEVKDELANFVCLRYCPKGICIT